MEYLYERVAYLRGLVEGLGIENSTKEGKVITNIIDVLSDFADAINELNESQEELDEYVEAIDEDLSNVEDELFDEDEDDYEDDDYGFIEVECPHCNEYVYLDEEVLDKGEEVLCPNCHEPIEIDMDCCHHDCCCDE
ncbi:CD1247 N-terminal domain-containing protein [Lutispora saccharofermentans]|uniref:Zinc-ribbon domain-containing protein n=1 Tax=Lutispora saccharofermentans TaxID=3024236 RepID=A0ABT1NEY8_9FIRM|nr:CD1247 N-terminal domain-containing protein [Lutispora saccharofermentans]MCQ1529817.1 zinc-ribbon domain-containing protein [Lutispora saccharofermentans]